MKEDGSIVKGKVSKFLGFEGLNCIELLEVSVGYIVAIVGFVDVNIGEILICFDEF